MVRTQAVNLILRAGVAFAFLFAGIDSFLEPFSWVDYIPQALSTIAPAMVLLHVFAAVEILLALWLLWGYKARIPAAIMALMLVVIVGLNFDEFQLLFRDISIAAAALAIALGPEIGKNRAL
jgi:uncharacterized membrane protein YphA (DoxX/SURF4 family)